MAYTGTKAQVGRGTTVGIGATPTLIGQIKDSGITGAQWGTEDATSFDSGIDQEFLATIRNNGEANLMIQRVSSDAGQTALEAAFDSGAVTPFTITLPMATGQTVSGDKLTFSAIVLSRDITINTEKIVMLQTKLKISGAVTVTLGS